ncbi:hypothetical protein PTSG_00436 [Salpingoeca rosetta]|uniref:Uncharacterized protein n=1 Tax=Salpingoeca rosetta (strain ATCC 50818 / BSB-021) TaxID=946362 RepID=F2TWH0_SALR5|nr:uncharacterized protein PTSG_00436 [Salpingoeca rosetta]EGD72416.1 hypothetical protein PTSG_00436 [Salpingoeca rosetta]|eukprot:XP_004998985.1 hypothetical protein PTSG_00436 [Salpingoeca rosetta]
MLRVRGRSLEARFVYIIVLAVVYTATYMYSATSGDPSVPVGGADMPPWLAQLGRPRAVAEELAEQQQLLDATRRSDDGANRHSNDGAAAVSQHQQHQQQAEHDLASTRSPKTPTRQEDKGVDEKEKGMKFEVEGGEDGFVPREHMKNAMGMPDTAEADPWKRRRQDKWRLIILFQHNFPILKQAVEGFQRASDIMVPSMIIVDNSKDRDASNSVWLVERVAEVVVPDRQLNFPELHNYMATLALERRLEFYFWAHADNYVLPLEPGRDMGKDAIDCLREQMARFPNWGMILFAYDHLAAYRTQTLVQVPWDPHVFQYGSECDAYGRIRDAGYDARACKIHYSYDMKRVIGILDTDSYDRVKAKLDEEAKDKSKRNQWREGAMSEKEQQWRKRMKEASRAYLAEKWGEVKCKLRGVPCHKPWPYCPTCPTDLPQCYGKEATWEQLDHIHARVHQVFDNDPDKPPPLEA